MELFTGAAAGTTMSPTKGGLVPTPPNDATKFLDGTGAFSVPSSTVAAAGTLTGTTLAAGVTASSLTSFGVGIALGTPASGTLTNATGLPLGTGVTGILTGANGGTGVANTSKTLTLGGSYTINGTTGSTLNIGTGGTALISGGALSGTTLALSGAATSTAGTITANAPTVTATQTWNNAAVDFFGITSNITNTASGANSSIVQLQVNGSDVFRIYAGGFATFSGPVATTQNFQVPNRWTLAGGGLDGQTIMTNYGGTAGVGFDVGTDGVFKLRNRAFSADAALTAAAATFSGALTYGGVTLSNAVTGTGSMVLSASPALTGNPTAPTPLTADSTTSIATTAFVKAQGYATGGPFAPLASPTFTGNPTAPTPLTADSTTSLATTAFVKAQGYATGGPFAPTASPTFTGTVTAAAANFSGSVLAVSSSGIGYGTGAGGTVTQASNKGAGVTLNTVTGKVTMNAAALAAGARISFNIFSTAVAANDGAIVWVQSAASGQSYRVDVTSIAAGNIGITLENTTAGSLSEAVVIGFAIIKASNS